MLDFLRDGAAALPGTQFELNKLWIDARKFQACACVRGSATAVLPAANVQQLWQQAKARRDGVDGLTKGLLVFWGRVGAV